VLQRLAHLRLPDLVSLPLRVGSTIAEDGKELAYSVTAYYDETMTLEEVWDTLDQAEQRRLMDSVVRSMQMLQKLDMECDKARQILAEILHIPKDDTVDSLLPMDTFIGSLELGYFSDVKQFLGGILLANSPKSSNCTLSESVGGIVIESTFDDVGRVNFTRSDLDNLQQNVVFCHNDLEPRNLLVKQSQSGVYELAAIIDWEMACFCPFAYEYGIKDTVLGSSNLSFQWYSLFKERAAPLLPQEECHTKLIKAIRVIDESKKRSMKRNVGVCFQAKWVKREKIEMSIETRRGWVRREGIKTIPPFTKGEQVQLELEVLKELGYV
jgi:hypothetical protein